MSGFGSSDSNETTPTSPVFGSAFTHGSDMNGHSGRSGSRHHVNPELEQARPQTVGEEELQLQLALAMSKEEADQEEKRRRSDDLKLQMALSQSNAIYFSHRPYFEQVLLNFVHFPGQDQMKPGSDYFNNSGSSRGPNTSSSSSSNTSPPKPNSSALVDLLDVDLGGAAGYEAQLGAVGGMAVGPDPWAPKTQMGLSHSHGGGGADPWSASSSTLTSPQDPWYPNKAGGAVGGAIAGKITSK